MHILNRSHIFAAKQGRDMKLNKSLFIAFGLLVLSAALYRVWDGRPLGFAPQIAMAIFAGAIVKNKKFAFILPLLTMFISDALYHVLYLNGLSEIPGFYEGQLSNYILFTALTVFGFMITSMNWVKILAASLAAPTVYFLLSNLLVWLGNGGYQRSKTFDGLLMSYADGLPFYRGSLIATVMFSIILFGSYFLINRFVLEKKEVLA